MFWALLLFVAAATADSNWQINFNNNAGCGCGNTPAAAKCPAPMKLSFLGAQVVDSEATVGGVQLGGLSSLAYNPADNTLFVGADTTPGPSYVFRYTPILSRNGVSFQAQSVFTLNAADLEGLEFDVASGNLVFLGESPLTIGRASATGSVLSTITVPAAYQQVDVENLAYSNGYVYFAAEEGLTGDTAQGVQSFATRIAKFSMAQNQLVDEYLYVTDPYVPLAAVVVVDDNTWITMEKNWVPELGRNEVRLYKVTPSQESSVLGRSGPLVSGGGVTAVPPLRKELLVDMHSLLPGLAAVDNFEGLTLGPKLPDGSMTVLVVTDNNFQEFGPQVMEFAAFAIDY